MSDKITFVVVSGNYEWNHKGSYDRDIKYISEDFENFGRALKEWSLNKDYMFNEIELWRDGRREGLVNPVPVDLT